MPGGFNPNAAYQQVSTDTGQLVFLQGGVYFDINGAVVTSPFGANGPSTLPTAVESSVRTGAKVMVNGDTIFVAVGDCQILNLISECVTGNDATASTLQYSVTPTVGTPTTISGATTTLQSVVAGTLVVPNNSNLATAPQIVASGVGIGSNLTTGVIFPDGQLKLVIGVGSTTGTWTHYIRYRPLQPGAYVKANQ